MRKAMESCVLAVNKYLEDKVVKMTESELLSNMHPEERESFNNRIYINSFKKTERINQ